MQIDERLARRRFVIDQHQRTCTEHHVTQRRIGRQVDQVRAGVAVLFFKAGKQFGAGWMARADQIQRIRARFAVGTVHTGTQADGRFGHADDEHRAWQVYRNLVRQVLKTLEHYARARRDVTAKHPRNKQKRALGIAPLGKAEQ
ncbi:hypothetical protein ALP75_204413 [Pseudomonas syringae pv. actinidiae]|nr:hypothetical protein ALP75_204413 [Pseudomonas syringae pv. actinidiae]